MEIAEGVWISGRRRPRKNSMQITLLVVYLISSLAMVPQSRVESRVESFGSVGIVCNSLLSRFCVDSTLVQFTVISDRLGWSRALQLNTTGWSMKCRSNLALKVSTFGAVTTSSGRPFHQLTTQWLKENNLRFVFALGLRRRRLCPRVNVLVMSGGRHESTSYIPCIYLNTFMRSPLSRRYTSVRSLQVEFQSVMLQ